MASEASAAVRGAAIDIESLPCLRSVEQAPASSRQGHGRGALHRVVCASVLTYDRLPDGTFARLGIDTWHEGICSEGEIIAGVEGSLPDPLGAAELLSWNGIRHDLRVLRQRAMRLWMFDMPRLRGWSAWDVRHRHHDMMLRGAWGSGSGDWWALADVLAGLGMSLRAGRPDRTSAQNLGDGRIEAVAFRNRRDVIGTLLAYAWGESFNRGCPLPLASAWLAVAEFVGRCGNPDEVGLARHHLVQISREAMDEHDPCCPCAATRSNAG